MNVCASPSVVSFYSDSQNMNFTPTLGHTHHDPANLLLVLTCIFCVVFLSVGQFYLV